MDCNHFLLIFMFKAQEGVQEETRRREESEGGIFFSDPDESPLSNDHMQQWRPVASHDTSVSLMLQLVLSVPFVFQIISNTPATAEKEQTV